MEAWLEWARGPVFRACFAILLLGLLRAVVLDIASVVTLVYRSKKNGREIPWRPILTATWEWMLPYNKGLESRPLFSVTSILFHFAAILTPIFLGAHVLLWQRGLGVGWPSINNGLADFLTWLAIAAGLALFIQRLAHAPSRSISRAQDYILPVLLLVPFISGYLAMHPHSNPFDYDGTMFVHVMSANLIFLVAPFSKLSHMVLFPSTQAISALGWNLSPGSGQRVAIMLGKEDEPI